MAPSFRLQTLGDLRLTGPGGELLPRRRMELTLLAYLAAQSPRAVKRAELQALLWGEREEEKAQNSLRRALLALRRALGDDVFVVGPREVRVTADAIVLDARELERNASAGRHAEAVNLWTGEFLPDADALELPGFHVWLDVERARLHRIRDACFEQVVASHESAGDWRAMVESATRWAELAPWDERPQLRLIDALRLDGRIGDALSHEAAFSQRLRAELDREPSVAWKRAVGSLAKASTRVEKSPPRVNGSAEERDVVFRQIMAAWRAVHGGAHRSVFIESTNGEHAEVALEFVRWMHQTNQAALVLQGPSARGGASPDECVRLLLAPLAQAPGLAGAAPEDLAELTRYVPGVRDRFTQLPEPANSGDGAPAVGRVLSAAADDRPLVLAVTDVGAHDEAMRAFLLGVARTLSGPVLLLLSGRSSDAKRVVAGLSAGGGAPLHLRVAASPRSAPARVPGRRLAFTAGVIAVSIAAWGVWLVRWLTPHPPVIAVGTIDMAGVPDSLRALPVLLATDLARVQQLVVISESRMHQLMTQLAASRLPADGQRAARLAGATEVIEGIFSRRASGVLRLDVRRVDVKTGSTRGAFTVESNDAFDLVDLATERIAKDLGGEAPSSRFATTTRSLVAYRLYEEGLREYYAGAVVSARKFFLSALREDSTFAMAAFYAARLSTVPEIWTLMQQAARMSRHATDRERLLILANHAASMQDVQQLAFAESLATRYPAEPDGHLAFADALVVSARFLDAVPHLRRAIEMDSLGLRRVSARCVACDAYGGLLNAYLFADSLDAAERAAREFVGKQPQMPGAWLGLVSSLNAIGRYDEALAALRTAATLDSAPRVPIDRLTNVWLRQSKFDSVDDAWQHALAAGTHDEQVEALNTATISLRMQGRPREALAMAIRERELSRPASLPKQSAIWNAFGQATVLFELGRYRESAMLFDSLAAQRGGPSAARIGRVVAWYSSHAATAFAAANDTTRLRVLEDTVRIFGARSSYARDRRLHYYVRGLRLRAEGRSIEAADAFRRSVFSLVEGNTRAALELGRTLLKIGQPAEAATVLRAALAGPIGASGQYANRTELHELLGRAYDALGQRKEAAAQYQMVLIAWRRAEPDFAPRRGEIAQRVAVLASTGSSPTAPRVAARR